MRDLFQKGLLILLILVIALFMVLRVGFDKLPVTLYNGIAATTFALSIAGGIGLLVLTIVEAVATKSRWRRVVWIILTPILPLGWAWIYLIFRFG